MSQVIHHLTKQQDKVHAEANQLPQEVKKWQSDWKEH